MPSSTDILMRIKKDGAYLGVAGESQTSIDKNDELTKDFTPGKYVEIEDFDFGISLVDKDTSDDEETEQKGKDGKPKKKSKDGKFYKFTTSSADVGALYPVTIDEVSVSRQMDSSSPVLLTSCFNTKSLQQICIVKRKVAGGASKLDNIPYLRLEFDNVLITDLSWEVGDQIMKEKLKFVCRKITMKYRPQNPDGSPGVIVNAGPLTLVSTT